MAIRAFGIRVVSRLGIYERQQFKFVQQFALPGSTAIDVGANCGAYTMLLSRLVGRGGRVLAFEPISGVFSSLKKNAAKKRNIFCYQMGLSSTESTGITLWIPLLFGKIPDPALAGIGKPTVDHSSTMSRWAFGVSSGGAVPMQKEIINTRPLDAFIDDMDNVSFIKVDVEGHETEFFKGARRVLSLKRPVVQFETLDMDKHGDWFRNFAKEVDYEVYLLTAQDTFERATPENLTRSTSANYYLMPKERPLPSKTAA